MSNIGLFSFEKSQRDKTSSDLHEIKDQNRFDIYWILWSFIVFYLEFSFYGFILLECQNGSYNSANENKGSHYVSHSQMCPCHTTDSLLSPQWIPDLLIKRMDEMKGMPVECTFTNPRRPVVHKAMCSHHGTSNNAESVFWHVFLHKLHTRLTNYWFFFYL